MRLVSSCSPAAPTQSLRVCSRRDYRFVRKRLPLFVRSGRAHGDVDSAAQYWAAMSQENVETIERAIAAINVRDIRSYLACWGSDRLAAPVGS